MGEAYYEPDILSANDYYPFGMLSRVALSSIGTHYKFGFNGKEHDWEAKGWQNQVYYGMRVYDPRLGRFLSVDPLQTQYPELTPFQYASNRPIDGIDLGGLEFSPARLNGPNGVARESTAILKYSEHPANIIIRQAAASRATVSAYDPSRKSWTQKWRDSDNILARISYDIANGLYTLPQQLTADVRNADYIYNIGGKAYKARGLEGEKQRLTNFVNGATTLIPGSAAAKSERLIGNFSDDLLTKLDPMIDDMSRKITEPLPSMSGGE